MAKERENECVHYFEASGYWLFFAVVFFCCFAALLFTLLTHRSSHLRIICFSSFSNVLFLFLFYLLLVRVDEFLWFIRLFLPILFIFHWESTFDCCVWHARQYNVCNRWFHCADRVWVNVLMVIQQSIRFVCAFCRKQKVFTHSMKKGKTTISNDGTHRIWLAIHSIEHTFVVHIIRTRTRTVLSIFLSFSHLILYAYECVLFINENSSTLT